MDKQDVEDIAELKVRRYFDHFLEKTLPCILEKHASACVHGKAVSRWKWMLAGITLILSLTGSAWAITKLLTL